MNDVKRAHQSLLGSGIQVDMSEEFIYLTNHSNEKVAVAVNILVRDGISVYRVEEEKESLENIFLKMTREGEIK